MAGPGGGPPRKSHTKSRKGCKTCKRRHIRCDETFPQCKNCTKHNCRCDYQDQPAPVDNPAESPTSELLSDVQVVEQLKAWRTTGHPPFPELGPPAPTYWEQFSVIDQRLLHHIAGLSHDIHERGYSKFMIWTNKMPILLNLALSNAFVMSAVLALSASHLSWMTESSSIQNLAYQHRGIALKGLHEAIGSFDRESSEAILAASILLSWQATQWRDWASLQQGISAVLDAMRPWIHETELGVFLEEKRASRGLGTPVISSPPLPRRNPPEEDLARLDEVVAHLFRVRQSVSNDEELLGRLTDLINFIELLKLDFPVSSPEAAFERLQSLRMWLFWLPAEFLRPDDSDLGPIAVLSHFFSSALLVELLFPEIGGGSYFGSMVIGPIEEMRTVLLSRQAANPQDTDLQVALQLTEFPHRVIMRYAPQQQYLSHGVIQYTQPMEPFSPQFTLRSSYHTSEAISPYHEDTASPPANMTNPLPSPYFHPGRLPRPASYTSQASHVSRSPSLEATTSGYNYLPGGSDSMPDDFYKQDVPHEELLLPRHVFDDFSQFYATSASSEDLWA